MERRTLAVWLVATGLLVGLLGNFLFYDKLIGLSFPLYTAVCVGVLLAAARPARQRLRWRNLWPLIPLGFFALMVAVRADDEIGLPAVLAALALGALALHYLTADRYIDDEPLSQHASAVLDAAATDPRRRPRTVGFRRWAAGAHLQERVLVAVTRGLGSRCRWSVLRRAAGRG
jgi:hypothetical protein